MLYATIDEGGFLTGFYDARVHDVIPEGALEISGELHQEWATHQNHRRWDADSMTLVEGERPRPPLTAAQEASERPRRFIARLVEIKAAPADLNDFMVKYPALRMYLEMGRFADARALLEIAGLRQDLAAGEVMELAKLIDERD